MAFWKDALLRLSAVNNVMARNI